MLEIQTEFHRFGPVGLPPYLIAEIGLNHNGDVDLACRMADAAQASGAHCAKFQLFDSRAFLDPAAPLGDGPPGGLAKFFAGFELSADEWRRLAEHVRGLGLDFVCSVFDAPSLDLYAELMHAGGVPNSGAISSGSFIKVASCDVNNELLFRGIEAHAGLASDLPILFSTGTASEAEVERALGWIAPARPRLIFECVSAYPAPPADYNLALLERWRRRFECPVGLSDHTESNALSLAAVAMGARAIERHFTLDRDLPGPDQALSLDPADFRALRDGMDAVFAARGGGPRIASPSEDPPRIYGRRALYAARDLRAGAALGREDLIARRPGGAAGSYAPTDAEALLGAAITRDVAAGALITEKDVRADASREVQSP